MNSYQDEVTRTASASAAALHHAPACTSATTETSAPKQEDQPVVSTVLIEGDRSHDILQGRYRLGTLLSLSRLGVVYRAYDLQRMLPCAIKLIPPCADQALWPERRLRHESTVLSRLCHPNIMNARGLDQDNQENFFLVLDLMQGRSLQQLLDEQPGQKLPLSRVLEILRGVVAGLQHAHEHDVVHGDLKPSSVFLHREGVDAVDAELHAEIVQLLDFGLARLIGTELPDGVPFITPDKIIGTPAYLAPEALFSERNRVDARSDQWAVAVLAYRMLTGRLPFFHENPHHLAALIREREPEPVDKLLPELPPCVALAIHTALHKDKRQRFASVEDFLLALEGLPPRRPRLSDGMNRPTLSCIYPELIELCRLGEETSEGVPQVVSDEHSTKRYSLSGELAPLLEQERQAAQELSQDSESEEEDLWSTTLEAVAELRWSPSYLFLNLVFLLSAVGTALALVFLLSAVSTALAAQHMLASKRHAPVESASHTAASRPQDQPQQARDTRLSVEPNRAPTELRQIEPTLAGDAVPAQTFFRARVLTRPEKPRNILRVRAASLKADLPPLRTAAEPYPAFIKPLFDEEDSPAWQEPQQIKDVLESY